MPLDDLRWAVRYTLRRPVFSLAVALTLAISIAAATTAFGLANAVLWRALPFADASQLVFVWEEVDRDGERHASRVTGSRFAAWRDTASGLSSLALFGAAGFTVDDQGNATSVRGVRVSANYFDTLGIRAALGRTFVAEDEIPGNHRVVILSDAFWRERFGARRDVVGGTLRLSGQPFAIVGVMPPVTSPGWPVNPAVVLLDAESRQFWVPIPRTADLDQSGRSHVFGAIGRLAPGVGFAEAVRRLNRTSSGDAPDAHQARLVPLRDQFVADARTPLLTLAAAALAVLLIACANLAALFVSAFESRRHELATRAAVGAAVPRLVRQLSLEALLLTGTGAAGGMLLARAALATLPGLLPSSLPFLTTPALDLRVAAFAIALALVATLLLAGWPILRLVVAPSPRGVAERPRPLVYRVLVVSQIAVTVALATAAGLLAQSLTSVRRQDPGFALDRVFVADIGIPAAPGASPRLVASAEQRLLAAIAALPGAGAVAAAYDHPLEANWSESPTIAAQTTAEERRRQAELRIVSPGYFEAMDVEVLDGRAFTERDTLDAPGAALVNEAFAREIAGGALGRQLRTGTPRFLYGDVAPDTFTIVGIVANERFRGLEQPAQPAFYLSTRQFPQSGFSVLVRTAAEPLAVAADVRAAIRSVDASITINRPTSLGAILAEQLVARRVTTNVIGGFALAALALAALGIYGLFDGVVSSRRREIGVRLAIGASPASVARHIVADSVRNAAAGLMLGGGLALVAGRVIQSLLVGVSSRDALTLGAVAALLLGVAVLAAVIPARRAARIDPADVLRAVSN